jgi:hypothetical protein
MLDLLLITLTDKTPEPEDVKAGWTALIIFLLLALAVAGLGWSLVRQLRKAQSAKDLGLYGDEPVDREAEARALAEAEAAERDERSR